LEGVREFEDTAPVGGPDAEASEVVVEKKVVSIDRRPE
jgi:hypothetical protein